MRKGWFWILVMMWVAVWPIAAQDDAPDIEVIFPQPVSLLRGQVEVIGTVNDPNMSNFYLQFRRLNDDLTPVDGDNALWSPASMPQTEPITDDVLGVWDTEFLDDGIYALALVVNQGTAEPLLVEISPLRVENTPSPYAGGRFVMSATDPDTSQSVAPLFPTPTAVSGTLPTAQATATRATSNTLTVRATVQANVRMGDSTLYPPVGILDVGQEAVAIARSSRSTWLQIRMSDGTEGFIAPSTLAIDGDTTFLPTVVPPPPPYTATPVPTATPIATATPITQANLRIAGFRFEPSSPQCGQTFNLIVNVENNGTGATNASGLIDVKDRHLATGNITETTLGGFPVLAAGQRFDVIIPITVTAYFNEAHRIELNVDVYNQVAETNKGDNFGNYDYTLGQGGC